MADYSPTATDVVFAGTGYGTGISGEVIAAGEIVYKKASDGKLYLADSDAAGAAGVLGMAINSATKIGQPVSYVSSGEVTVGAVFASAGLVIALSDTAGDMCDVADVITDDVLVLLGWSTATTKVQLNIINTEITIA